MYTVIIEDENPVDFNTLEEAEEAMMALVAEYDSDYFPRAYICKVLKKLERVLVNVE